MIAPHFTEIEISVVRVTCPQQFRRERREIAETIDRYNPEWQNLIIVLSDFGPRSIYLRKKNCSGGTHKFADLYTPPRCLPRFIKLEPEFLDFFSDQFVV